MSRRNLQAAIAAGGGVGAYINRDEHVTLSADELRQEIFDNKTESDASGAERMARGNKRNTLLKKAGFDYFDVRELLPNPNNTYSLDPEQTKNLAALIYESKHTTPIVVRAIPEGLQIVDGHRRCEAHKLLGETYGEAWYMIPARCFDIGQLSDEDALFMLHAENMGQRAISPSERALGFKIISERLVAQRKNDPSLKGKKTRAILAEQFGISERTVDTELNIARYLVSNGQKLLDDGTISKAAADAISHLPKEEQQTILDLIADKQLSSEEATQAIKESARSGKPINVTQRRAASQRDVNDYLKKGLSALKRAKRTTGDPDLIMLAQIKTLVKEIEKKNDVF